MTASPSTVITLGYGSFGSLNLVPTLGYGSVSASAPAGVYHHLRSAENASLRLRGVENIVETIAGAENARARLKSE